MLFQKLKKFLHTLSIGLSVSRSIDKIKDAQFSLIFAPFNGNPIPVVVRNLTHAQIIACGDFSMIQTFQDKINQSKMPTMKQMLQYADRHHEILKKCIVAPSYDDILEVVGAGMAKDAKSRADEIEKKLKGIPAGPERDAIHKELDEIRLWTDLILPDDFTAYIISFVLGIDNSDIKNITEDILLKAAILAEKGHDNPCDHISGAFFDWMKDDINVRAWNVLSAEREKKKGKDGR